MSATTWEALGSLGRPLVYLDCGARGDSRNPLVDALPGATYIGIEADRAECERLSRAAPTNYRYYPVVLGKAEEPRTLHVTRNPACSSLLEPDHDFWGGFHACAPQIEVEGRIPVRTNSLAWFARTNNLDYVDFVELDTQGTELEILEGAGDLLSRSVLGIRTEAEFSPMYVGQPLFADVDAFVRRNGFLLFDLSRHRYRRASFPHVRTQGQLLYGHALYFRDYRLLSAADRRKELVNLAIIAGFHGFHDYALEILDLLLDQVESEPERLQLRQARNSYLGEVTKDTRLSRMLLLLERKGLARFVDPVAQLGGRLADAQTRLGTRTNFSWSD